MPSKKHSAPAKTKTVNKAKPRAETEPRFPFTTKPSSLRRLLQEIPKKPRPAKFGKTLLRSWGFNDANDYSMLRVLKAVDLLNDNNEPADLYAKYMHIHGGAATLAEPIKRIYAQLFQATHQPYNESNEQLQNLFNIHSGGTDRSLEQQVQTFKALCENTTFDEDVAPATISDDTSSISRRDSPAVPAVTSSNTPISSININLHIHLPENKTRRDYECIIEDIGKYIFGRTEPQTRDE